VRGRASNMGTRYTCGYRAIRHQRRTARSAVSHGAEANGLRPTSNRLQLAALPQIGRTGDEHAIRF